MNPTLQAWNELDAAEAEAAILPANGSRAWARAMVEARPFAGAPELLQAADATWSALPPEDWQEAFDTHPRLGDTHAASATDAALAHSAFEQAASAGQPLDQALANANRLYEAHFGRVFLLRAAGRTQREILDALNARMHNSPEQEFQEAAEQQREITRLRLERWLGTTAPEAR